jgi:hypothetical protein
MFINAERIEYAFTDRRVAVGTLALFKSQDALDFIARAHELRVPIIGVDGFVQRTHNGLTPLTDIADYLGAAELGNGCWAEAADFVSAHTEPSTFFEIVTGEDLAPAR